jgi:hypothetical protein
MAMSNENMISERARSLPWMERVSIWIPADFRRRKLLLALAIMGVGMLIAVSWAAFQRWVEHKGYPFNTFLFIPKARFSDFTDMTLVSNRANPYQDPFAPYLPFAWVCLRVLFHMNSSASLIGLFFFSLGGLFLLLDRAFIQIISHPWLRAVLALCFLGLAYPVLICLDRGNIEIALSFLAATALFCFSRNRYFAGMLCLVPAISFKLYPALFLLLLLRQRRLIWTGVCVGLFLSLTLLSLHALSLPLVTAKEYYGRNMTFFNQAYFYENYALEGSASFWNTYKIGLIAAAKLGWIAPVSFSFDSGFIQWSYRFYLFGTIFLALGLAVYACLLEKEFLRCAMVLLLYLSVATPTGSDYRLLYANMALVLIILLKTRRRHDFWVLVLLALTMVPKKEVMLAFVGKTESDFRDVSIQVVLNPLFLLIALLLLLYDSRSYLDPRWIRLRRRRLIRAFSPWNVPSRPALGAESTT